MALCMVLYGLLYVEGLALSHRSAYHTLENLRLHLQSKLEKQPLGAIQEKGVGVWKKMFIDDIESMELLLAHALPEGLSNLAVPVVVFVAMFLTDWKLGLLSLCSLPLGVLAMGMMYRSGMSKMGDYYAAGQKMNNTIVEYINGMEVVKVFNRDGESYHRFETDVKNYRILRWIGSGPAGCGWPSTPAFCPAWRWCCCQPAAIWYSPAPLPCRITRWYCACLFPWGRLWSGP